MSFHLASIATAVPPHSITQEDAAAFARKLCQPSSEEAKYLENFFRRISINQRGSVLLSGTKDGQTEQSLYLPQRDGEDQGPTTEERMKRYVQEAGPLACRAASDAISGARLTASQIDYLITISCTGFSAPGVDLEILETLGLSSSVQRTHIGFMGCHAAVNGLRVASAFANAIKNARILVCAVELCTLHFSYQLDTDKIVANGLFADGAAAAIGYSDESNKSAADEWQLQASGSYIFPHSQEAMSWIIGNHGFEMTLSASVPDLIARGLRPWLTNWLEKEGLSIEQIKSWAVHPGGPRILKAVRSALDLEPESLAVSEDILKQHGNMSSATLFFILKRLRENRAGLPCVALAFGPGLVVEAILFV